MLLWFCLAKPLQPGAHSAGRRWAGPHQVGTLPTLASPCGEWLYPPGPSLHCLALAQRRLSLARLRAHRPALGWTPHMWALCQNRASPCKLHCSLPCIAQPLPS